MFGVCLLIQAFCCERVGSTGGLPIIFLGNYSASLKKRNITNTFRQALIQLLPGARLHADQRCSD